ncbi:MAG: bifunctional glutamate N-acetyltransferase/amino-acid acetyltransferase ArgJ [Pseudomonadota bacterium]
MRVSGFKAAAVASGMRYKNRLDLALIATDEPAAAAGVFTRNLVQAAPVLWSRERISAGRARGLLINAGQANACTGRAGFENAAESARQVSALLNCSPDEILLASTGVIGDPLNLEAMTKALPDLVTGLGEDNLGDVGRAIMTTDTRPKIVWDEGEAAGVPFTLVGLAKGAGMIAPNLATMLSFILTDAAVNPAYLQQVLRRSADQTFNRVTIDGDTSTNDTVFALASGKAGNLLLEDHSSKGAESFAAAFNRVSAALAEMIAADGEGATKLVRVKVSGARDQEQAAAAARTVADSPLVKTALFGQDPNWGRIMAALGRSSARFDPGQVEIKVNDAPLVKAGQADGDPSLAAGAMKSDRINLDINLGAGPGQAEILTCDFSLDYVRINADYRS